MTPEDLRKQASAAEFLAKIVSYAPDKARLIARAAELRAQADATDGSDAAHRGRPPRNGGAQGVA